ncbi:hypothetical protein evm_001471 [Chilo suppressalis]|nr:hypothetical protein evm_001471 [Chilo suppressalis]
MRCFAVLLLLFLQCYLQEASRFDQQVRNGYRQETRTKLNVVVRNQYEKKVIIKTNCFCVLNILQVWRM